MSSLKEIKRQITELEKQYNAIRNNKCAKKIDYNDEEAEKERLERIKTKVLRLNCKRKPITGRKKVCEYDCEFCNVICSSDETDDDFKDELLEYQATR